MDLNVVKYIWDHNPGKIGEYRIIKNKVTQDFVTTEDHHQQYLENLMYAGHDIYFGVLPRHNLGGKASDVPDLQNTLWADFDSKERDKSQTFVDALSVRPLPQILVDSGNGYHAYWMLRDPVARWQAERIMQGIAIRHGGDHTHDAARVLRVPGSLNYKTTPPMEVRLLKFDTTVMYTASDFSDYFNVGHANLMRGFVKADKVRLHTLADVPAWLDDLIRNTGNQKGTRSEDAFKVVCKGYENGFEAEEIEQWFKDNPQGIGQKYHEKRNGHRWFMVTFKAAQKSILSSKQRGF